MLFHNTAVFKNQHETRLYNIHMIIIQAWAAQPLKPILKNGICCDDDGFSGLSTVIKERMFAVRRDVSAVAGRDFIRFIVYIERQIPFQYVKTLLPFVYRIIYLCFILVRRKLYEQKFERVIADVRSQNIITVVCLRH